MAGDPILCPPEVIEVTPGLFVGGAIHCAMPGSAWTRGAQRATWAGVVHACKYPCHAELLGYADRGPKVVPDHPEYLIARRPGHLVMNMIDAEERFFRLDFFAHACDFIAASRRPVLVHCNQGASRSPSLTLVYLAKRTDVFHPLERATYDAARKAFTVFYPAYAPGPGIAAFLDRWWEHLR